ncbi:MAG TPA: PilZ domain-containing protein [Candidatus Acidoferrales bacterium]|nr:PilZ domain-containing protein [Candidatus Acidoferrales bacterium]
MQNTVKVDLRRHERIVVPGALPTRVTRGESGPRIEGVATVIGMGGMFCRTKDTQPPETVLPLALTCGSNSFEVECNVRYVNDNGMGIEFTKFTPENEQKLKKLLLQLRT